MIKKIIIILFVILNFNPHLWAENTSGPINLVHSDRVLILAPHPDDETIGTGGVIQRALKAGAHVKVVCYTNGDNNELAFIVYEKRLVFKKKAFLNLGETRAKETINAMASLGLNEKDIIFLGYPDFGTMEILTKYWQDTSPYRSIFPRQNKVPYPGALSFGAPYMGESILNDLKTVILDFRPTKIFVSHPADTNRDHRSLYLFLKVALWDLEGKIKPPEIFPYIIHVIGWPKPRGYHPDLELVPPSKLKGVSWQRFSLTDEEIKKKYDAILNYKSQIVFDRPYLFTFARKNELFGDYPAVKLKKENEKELTWRDLNMNEDIAQDSTAEEEKQRAFVSALSYAIHDNNLFIRLTLKRKIDKDFGIPIFLLGYNKKTDFSKMPKIRLFIDFFGLHVKEKKQTEFIKDVQLSSKGKTLIIKVPLSVLGSPVRILSYARTRAGTLTYDRCPWRIIELE